MLPKNSTSRTYLLTKAWKAQTKEVNSGSQAEETDRAFEQRLRAINAAKKKAMERAEEVVRKSGAQTLAAKEAVRLRYHRRNERTTPIGDYLKHVSQPVGNGELSSAEKARNAAATAAHAITGEKKYAGAAIARECSKNKVLGKIKARAQSKRWGNWYFEEDEKDQLAY